MELHDYLNMIHDLFPHSVKQMQVTQSAVDAEYVKIQPMFLNMFYFMIFTFQLPMAISICFTDDTKTTQFLCQTICAMSLLTMHSSELLVLWHDGWNYWTSDNIIDWLILILQLIMAAHSYFIAFQTPVHSSLYHGSNADEEMKQFK